MEDMPRLEMIVLVFRLVLTHGSTPTNIVNMVLLCLPITSITVNHCFPSQRHRNDNKDIPFHSTLTCLSSTYYLIHMLMLVRIRLLVSPLLMPLDLLPLLLLLLLLMLLLVMLLYTYITNTDEYA